MIASLKQLFFGNGKASKDLARSRLHFVLVQDRTGLTPEEMASYKKEMVDVIQRYFIIDEQAFDIAYKRDMDLTTLVINSPVVVRRQDAPGYEIGAKHQVKSKNSNKDTKGRKNSKSADSSSVSEKLASEKLSSDEASEESISEDTQTAHAG